MNLQCHMVGTMRNGAAEYTIAWDRIGMIRILYRNEPNPMIIKHKLLPHTVYPMLSFKQRCCYWNWWSDWFCFCRSFKHCNATPGLLISRKVTAQHWFLQIFYFLAKDAKFSGTTFFFFFFHPLALDDTILSPLLTPPPPLSKYKKSH